MPRADVAVDLAGDQAVFAVDVVLVGRPFAPDDLARVIDVDLVLLLDVHWEHQRPVQVVFHRVHEAVGDQQAEVELAQAAVLALGADELLGVRMADVEGAHLRAAAAAGAGDGETHLVVDVHERQRAAGVRAGAGDIGVARTQGAELVADAATGLQGEAGLVHLLQDVVHRIVDGARNGAVDRAGGRLVRQRAGVGGDAAGGDGPAAQRPQETLVPVAAQLVGGLHVGQRARHALVGLVDAAVDRLAGLGLQAILLVPDVPRGGLQRDVHGSIAAGGGVVGWRTHCAHRFADLSVWPRGPR